MYSLTDQQGKAVRKIIDWYKVEREVKPYFTLGGFAGTGKSTILPDFVDGLGLDPSNIAFAAPTGKAAKVMGEKLRSQGYTDALPSTIHSLIYTPRPMKAEELERDLLQAQADYDAIRRGANHVPDMKASLAIIEQKIAIIKKDLDRAYDVNDLRFTINSDGKLLTGAKKLVIVDEASMVDEEMAEDLMSFGVPVLAIGDPGQLPPVGGNPGFMTDVPDAFLTEVHRQAADNPIIHLATLARQGKVLEYGDYGNGVMVIDSKSDVYSTDLERDCQIIVGTNKKRWKLTSKLRRAAGYNSMAPCHGEPLIMCKNSKQFPNLVNGTPLFSAKDHDELIEGENSFQLEAYDEDGRKHRMWATQGLFEEHKLRVKNAATASKSSAFKSKIKDNHVDFGWAITCHKAQGSQWDEVIVHDESAVFRESADKWLYTAITRAAERLVVVSE